jgi:Retroviral aspartyl protease
MTGRASEKIMLPTIADDGMEGDESLHVARQPTCEDHDTIIENVSFKGADIEEEEESEPESKRFSVRAKGGEVRRPSLPTSLNDTKHRYGLNQLLGIGVLFSGRKVTALVDSGCEAELIISRRFAQKHGIAAAETARSRGGIALPDETMLVATETESLELDADGVRSTCKALVIDITAYDCIVGLPWLDRHNPHVNWRKNRLMIVKNGRRYDLDARKDPCVSKWKNVKLLSAKQLCRMVKGNSKTILVTLQAIEKNSAPRKMEHSPNVGKVFSRIIIWRFRTSSRDIRLTKR